MFFKILCKAFFAAFLNIMFKFVRLIPLSTTSVKIGVAIGDLHTNTTKSFFRFPLFKKYWALFIRELGTRCPNSVTLLKLYKQLEIEKPQENKHLLLIICWLFRINLDKDFEFILSKKFAGDFNSTNSSTDIKFKNLNTDRDALSGNKNIYDTIENKMVHNTVDFAFSETNKHTPIENLFLL